MDLKEGGKRTEREQKVSNTAKTQKPLNSEMKGSNLFFFIKFFCNVYLFLRERQSVSGGVAEREGETESKAGSRL